VPFYLHFSCGNNKQNWGREMGEEVDQLRGEKAGKKGLREG